MGISAIGIMSGTSIDGIDAVILEIPDAEPPHVSATLNLEFPPALQQTLHRLSNPGDNEIDLAGYAHIELGNLYAEAANRLLAKAPKDSISVIGCHGQTVRHRPSGTHPFTLQLGSGAVISQQTGLPVVTDFRSADMAAGGQGAPFAPFFHKAVFASDTVSRAVINLGGIANITLLPKDPGVEMTGFDTGPASCLLDNWVAANTGASFDNHGQWGRGGTLNESLLKQCLNDPYFSRPSPKSTGREYFNLPWIQKQLSQLPKQLDAADVQNTLTWLTAHSIAHQLPQFIEEVYLCGGGVHNDYLLEALEHLIPCPVGTTMRLGVNPQWIEAAAFAWMASATLQRIPCTLPSVTGASRPVITGALYYPD